MLSKVFSNQVLHEGNSLESIISNNQLGTAADLRSAPIDSNTAVTLGVLVAGDGGGGLWRWDAASVLADNLGTVLLPTGHVGAGRWLRVYSGAVNVCWFGASSNSSALINTTAIQYSIDNFDTIYIPTGNYSITFLEINKTHFMMYGDGYRRTILTPTANATTTISIANISNSEGVTLKNFALVGNATCIGGISLGYTWGSSAALEWYWTAFVILEELDIRDYTNSSFGYGISLNAVQETDIKNCQLRGNRNNIYRPNSGFCTSTQIVGKAGYCGRATNNGILLDGTCSDIYIKETVLESIQKEAIKFTESVSYGNSTSQLFINECYFEANNLAGTGLANVAITGTSESYKKPKVVIRDCYGLSSVYLSNTIAHITGNYLNPSNVTTDAGCFVRFDNNRIDDAGDWMTGYKNLAGNIITHDFAGSLLQANLMSSITFPGTARLSSDANTLDDYEEGTWTPAGNSIVFDNTTGYYTKIGNLVFAEFAFHVPVNTDSVNGARIINLPIPTLSTGSGHLVLVSNSADLLFGRLGIVGGAVHLYIQKVLTDQNNQQVSNNYISGTIIYRAHS